MVLHQSEVTLRVERVPSGGIAAELTPLVQSGESTRDGGADRAVVSCARVDLQAVQELDDRRDVVWV
jgi:hypothetical protein